VNETVLPAPVWRARAAAHEARLAGWLDSHLVRRRDGVKHPVEDFLFTYYSHRPAQLRRWHPGFGVVLADAPPAQHYVAHGGGRTVDPQLLAKRSASIRWVRDLLRAIASRPPQLGCFGMHEWAMVYRQTQEQVRHNAWPLRLSESATAQVLQDRGVRCTHFDAFRFFTEPARPLNVVAPTRERQSDMEQPGCLHANMDLYKWAYKLSPLVPSELVGDCFALSREIRELDMRASPYDLADLGYDPVRVETPEGRAAYAAAQKDFAERARPLRARLIEQCEALLTAEPAPITA
jgi:hypothetical protein